MFFAGSKSRTATARCPEAATRNVDGTPSAPSSKETNSCRANVARMIDPTALCHRDIFFFVTPFTY